MCVCNNFNRVLDTTDKKCKCREGLEEKEGGVCMCPEGKYLSYME